MLRPIISEFVNAELERRITELERRLDQMELAISVGAGGDVTITSPMVRIEAAMTTASGVIQCDTIIANSVVGSSYTPGAGNVM